MNPSSERVGLVQMATAMTLSGTLGVFVLESGQSAWNVVFFRCLFGALALFVYCCARGLLKPGLFTARTLALALAAGAALVLNWVLLFSAYRLASISLATAVYNVQPFFLIGLGVLFLGERPTRGKLAWSVLAFAGLLLVLRLTQAGGADGRAYLSGLLLGLGAAALYGITAIIVKRLKHIPPQVLALVQVTLGAVMLLPMADFHALPAAPLQWSYLVALGLIHTCLMYILMYSAIQKLPTTSTAALSFIYPAVAILLDFVVYGHRMDATQITGVAMIFLAAAGVSLNWTWRLPGRPRAGAA
ncbi:putative cystine transporter YijE [Achromobacter anxifer]|jgi:drug/metabolite transporter (DMT)-like permease|uniref:Putative cystine transporter YijE n=1 Tax=Achromobacter anxifer TaxID=1287737 RepID=A0A6S7E5K6_9BURK|nr:DMT family transporter [Achromobacter anxifer]CAB3896966.1 putative cystine transporter YijE [Achromobacter anxifer]CAB5515591.1 putative cystine transporter YijE [Achromobacter anxifer]